MFATPSGLNAIAAPQQLAQNNNQAVEQEDDDVGEQEDDENEAEDENIDPSLSSQVKITPSEASDIAAGHLSVQSSAVQSIELEQEGGEIHYSVELLKDNQTFDVEVNAITGNVGTVELDD